MNEKCGMLAACWMVTEMMWFNDLIAVFLKRTTEMVKIEGLDVTAG